MRENHTNYISGGNARSENVDGSVCLLVVEDKTNSTGNKDRVDNSSQVLVALNALEMRKNKKLGGIKVIDEASGKPPNGNSMVMGCLFLSFLRAYRG